MLLYRLRRNQSKMLPATLRDKDGYLQILIPLPLFSLSLFLPPQRRRLCYIFPCRLSLATCPFGGVAPEKTKSPASLVSKQGGVNTGDGLLSHNL